MDPSEQLEYAKTLVSALESGDDETANEALIELGKARQTGLYQELGKLTRELHESLSNVGLDSKLAGITEVGLPDAKDRLNYVMDKTADSANKTMAAVESVMPLTDQLAERAGQLHQEWERLLKRELDKSDYCELSDSISSYLLQVQDECQRISGEMTNILMAQDFQDLTGQVIKRVIELVQDVETNLVDLVRATGLKHTTKESEQTAAITAEGPQIHAEQRSDVVKGQDDVDDLLSSLGF